MDIPVTGRSFRVRGSSAVSIAGGIIVEHRGREDALEIMRQLGADLRS
ncbi:MAG: ester cyclase [Anaerolineales bacterium]|nr:ester cyclase [Anaerolineales bacterium]